jgi:Cu2+-exporting ATPase
MLTGDNQQTAKEVADKLGIDNYYSQVLPDQKQTKLKEIQKGERFVLMVGDGINDAPALAQADLGIAIGSGTDIAAETADVILVKDKLLNILTVINFGKKTYNKMVQNLIWATAYNFFAIPLAAGVLFPLGIILSPAVGAILMSLSTVIVAINAKLLRLE